MSEPPVDPLPDDASRVLLLRSRDTEGEDRYVQALAEKGLRAVCHPVLRFAFAGNAGFGGDDVAARLRHPDRYAGLILTSPRAVRALARAFQQQRDPQQAVWKEKPAFAVGPKTAQALRENSFEPAGEESGDAATLARRVAEEMRGNARPLLFLCGDRRRDALPDRLRAEGVAFEEGVAYETHLREGPWLNDAFDRDAPDWAAFFSPSGVEAVRQAQEPGWEAVRKAALGPTTAGALRKAGWPPGAVARHPTPEALAEALAEARRQPPA